MVDIISFPHDNRIGQAHEDILAQCEKPFWVGRDIQVYLRAAGPSSLPKLMFADYSNLEALSFLSDDNPQSAFLNRIPTIAIWGSGIIHDLVPYTCGMNIVGVMPTLDQWKIGVWRKMIAAFDRAQEVARDQPVTKEGFAKALAVVETVAVPYLPVSNPTRLRHGGAGGREIG